MRFCKNCHCILSSPNHDEDGNIYVNCPLCNTKEIIHNNKPIYQNTMKTKKKEILDKEDSRRYKYLVADKSIQRVNIGAIEPILCPKCENDDILLTHMNKEFQILFHCSDTNCETSWLRKDEIIHHSQSQINS